MAPWPASAIVGRRDACEIMLRHEPKLHVDVGEAQVAVEQQGRRPGRASACASVMASQALPTLPLPEATAMMPRAFAGAAGHRACEAAMVIGEASRSGSGSPLVKGDRSRRARASAPTGATALGRVRIRGNAGKGGRPASAAWSRPPTPARHIQASVAIMRRQPMDAISAARSHLQSVDPAASTSGAARILLDQRSLSPACRQAERVDPCRVDNDVRAVRGRSRTPASSCGVFAVCSCRPRMRVNASSCSRPPARVASHVTAMTLRPRRCAATISFAATVVLPTPGGPTSISGGPGRASRG